MRRLPALRIVGCGGGVQSVPGIVGSVVGRRPNTGVRLGRLINQNSHVIRVPELSAAPPKRCNSNDAISMFEIHVGELRATFLRNHSMRRHKDPSRRQLKPKRHPKQKTTQAEDPRNPDNRHKRGGGAPVTWRCTRYVAVHPLRGGAPVTWRCTRTEEVHCLRIGCSAPTNKNKRGTDTPNHSPPHPSMRNWALLAAGWARRPRRHLHSSPLRPNPTPPTPLHAKSPITYPHTPAHKRDRGRRSNAATRRPVRPRIRRSTSLRPAALSLMNLRSTK